MSQAAVPVLSPERQRQVLARVSWRLLPLVVAGYLVAYIDRTNISFAALTMNADLGFSATLYGWGAGIFFLAYALFEVPSNLFLHRTSARHWIARIMISWGIVSGLMAAVSGPTSFLVLRFLLGVAEAGFFPGILYYLTCWYPAAARARAISVLYVAVPLSNVVAAVVSGWLLQLDGLLGLRGWQWIFLVEAVPAVVLGFVVLRAMTNRPREAGWLTPEERDWLEATLEAERRLVQGSTGEAWKQVLSDPRVLVLALIYLLNVTASYGTVFFMPQMVKSLGLSNALTGLVTAIPYTVGLAALLAWGWSSDRRGERRWHLIASTALASGGFLMAALTGGSWWSVVAMSLATAGFYASRPSFWPMPSRFLAGAGAAAGLAFINALGNLGGYVGPMLVGTIRDRAGGFGPALVFMAGCALASTLVALLAVRTTSGTAGTAAREG